MPAPKRKGAGRLRRGPQQVSDAGGRLPQPPPPSPFLAERLRPTELDGWSVGDTVRLLDAGEATYKVLGFVVPVSPDDPATPAGPWAELFGGFGKEAPCLRAAYLRRLRRTAIRRGRSTADVNTEHNVRARTAPPGSPGLAELVRATRARLGWSRRELAEASGLHQGLLDRVEGGSRGLTGDEAVSLLAATGLDLADVQAAMDADAEAMP